MKVLKCPCGAVKIGALRRHKYCGQACPAYRAANRASLEQQRAKRIQKRLKRIAQLTPEQAEQYGYLRGYRVGREKGRLERGL